MFKNIFNKAIEKFIPKILSKVDSFADKCADLFVSKPKVNEDFKESATAIGLGVASGTPYAITTAAISATEYLATAGYSATAIQTTATVAAAGTEIMAAGVSATSSVSSITTAFGTFASGGAGIVAAGGAILFSSLVAGKVAYRASTHAYNYVYGTQSDNNEMLALEDGLKVTIPNFDF